MNYGVIPTGFNRKPLAVIHAEIEERNKTEFGAGVIQTSQSPLGQINGVMADTIAEIWERAEDVYQSYDPSAAEGSRLDILAALRLIRRGTLTDLELRRAITNQGQSRIDVQDLAFALRSLPGVTYANVAINDSGEVDNSELQRGFVAVTVIGGDDDAIAEVVRSYIVPGVSTYGNVQVSSTINGFCRSVSIIRPIDVEVNLQITVRLHQDRNGCPAPGIAAIVSTLLTEWDVRRQNGMDVSAYTLRSIIESSFTNVEFVSFSASRDGADLALNETIEIGFTEIASLNVEILTV